MTKQYILKCDWCGKEFPYKSEHVGKPCPEYHAMGKGHSDMECLGNLRAASVKVLKGSRGL